MIIKFIAFLIAFVYFCSTACGNPPTKYVWNEITKKAGFAGSYGFPVFVIENRMAAFHHEAVWNSADGVKWTKTDLPPVKRDAYEARYVQFNNAVYALGQNQGNYVTGIRFGSTVRRTTDFKKWETLAEKSELPDRVFYGSIVFGGKIWLMGGYDGKNYHNDIWNSTDGVRWTRVSEHAAWSPRNAGIIVEFKNRIWMLGGGVIDGDKKNNPNAGKEVWTSTDGVNWTEVKINSPYQLGGTPVVFDGKLWLIGGNRNNGNFDSALFVSDDGINWRSESAPWTPRGAVAAWVFGDKLFITGGKYSYAEPNGEIKFVYSNDVWALSKKTE